MKKIFRKNQLVITALALMIAVAGYFSYMNNNMDDGKLQTAAEAANAEVSAGELEEDYDISDEDVLQNEIFTAEEPDGTETAAVTDGSAETAAGTEGEPAAEGTGQTVAMEQQGQRKSSIRERRCSPVRPLPISTMLRK